jgi:hypothetical protein
MARRCTACVANETGPAPSNGHIYVAALAQVAFMGPESVTCLCPKHRKLLERAIVLCIKAIEATPNSSS